MADANAREMEQAASRAEARGALERCGHVLFRWRSFTPVPLIALAIPLIWSSRGEAHSPLWLAAGLLCCLAGQLLRAWVIGQVPDGTSGQNEKLIATGLNTRGPYARVRNPLYLGNLGISLGLALVAHSALLFALTGFLFFVQYAAIISVEEAFLRERFGAEYLAYCARVPRFWPDLFARSAAPSAAARDSHSAARPWSLARAIRKEHNPLAAWLLLSLLFLALDQAVPLRRAGAALSPSALGLVPFAIAAALVVAIWLCAKGWKHHWLSGNFTADLKRRIRETSR